MDSQVLYIISTVLSIIISIVAVLGIIIRFSDKIFKRMVVKTLESTKLKDINQKSELGRVFAKLPELIQRDIDIAKQRDGLSESVEKLNTKVDELSEGVDIIMKANFKSDLRSRLEYIVRMKGKVDIVYWDHVVEDFNYYVKELKMNSYINSLYTEAEKLFIKVNVKDETQSQ